MTIPSVFHYFFNYLFEDKLVAFGTTVFRLGLKRPQSKNRVMRQRRHEFIHPVFNIMLPDHYLSHMVSYC